MNLDDLRELADQERGRQQKLRHRILVCAAAGCASCGSAGVRDALVSAVQAHALAGQSEVIGTGCMGLCGEGPLVKVDPDGILYQRVDAGVAARIVEEHIVNGRPVEEHCVDLQAPFFTSQLRIVLENCGRINSESIEEYLGAGGYSALGQVLGEMEPEEVVAEIRKSGLRGRGGAGYPTGLKWEIVRKMPSEQKYVVCNADEGDPGAFMDRSVLEGDPHRILEGMAIAAYATGANQGYVYIRAEYPLAIERLRMAIKHAERLGLLGNRILDSQFNFRIDLRIGAGAFVCGEETAPVRVRPTPPNGASGECRR
jgi:bidirectional [NiFe] hydrogenase diaphorase subunit